MSDTQTAPPAPPPADSYVVVGWLVVLPNGWESLHREQSVATQYAARSHGIVEPIYRKVTRT